MSNLYIAKGKFVISVAISFLICAILLTVIPTFSQDGLNISNFEYINIKDMAATSITNKVNNNNVVNVLFKGVDYKGIAEEVNLPSANNTVATLALPKQVWYLPTQVGRVTQNPHYGHVALDITSPRGTAETIFPVANGTISSIYTDSAGAKIVTVYHNINGQDYTSQYVHMSSYAQGLYVGKPVTINDALGQMGATGIATGVHLHLAVLDCKLYDKSDPNCPTLGSFFVYANQRVNQGYSGLGNLMYVPGSWDSR